MRYAGARTRPGRTEKLIGNTKKNPFVARGDRADHQLTALESAWQPESLMSEMFATESLAMERLTGIAPQGMLFVASNVDAADEADFNQWYDREHVEERARIEGFISRGAP
ncbi:hypothetical protein ACU4GD_08835 [Cupriavidus basilensis]